MKRRLASSSSTSIAAARSVAGARFTQRAGRVERVGALAVQRVQRAEGVRGGQARGRVQDAQLIAERRQQAHQRALRAHDWSSWQDFTSGTPAQVI